jgi:hypothetical protein
MKVFFDDEEYLNDMISELNTAFRDLDIRYETISIDSTGEELYNYLKGFTKDNSGKKSSMTLLNYDIKGLKYLDQGSRDVSKKTFNYVIWDAATVSMINKEKKTFKK